MFKKIFLIIIFIISLLFSTFIVIIENSDHATSCPEFESDTYCTVYDATPYVIFTLSTIICIVSGHYLFRRKKEQINSDGQNVKVEDQFYSFVIFAAVGAGACIALLLVLMRQI